MELRHLRYFIAVAEERHVGRAAQRLHIAQPPLSRQIRDLEREVGTPLFERTARGVTLTPAGRAFLAPARLTLAQAERAQRTAQRAAAGEIGRLRVAFAEAATNSGILPDVLGFFRMHLPRIGLSLFEMDSVEQEDAFRDGWIDLGIMQSVPGDADRWLTVDPVYAEPLMLALTEGHRLTARARLSLGDVAQEAFVLFPRRSDPALYDDVLTQCREAGFSPRVSQEAFGWQTLTGLVGAGVGLAFVPRSLSRIQRPGVVFRRVRGLDAELRLFATWRKGDRSPVRERFITALRAVASAGAGARA